MIRFIIEYLKKKSTHHFGIVLTENVISKGLNFVLIILVARALGPSDYGLYSLIIVSIQFLAPFLDFGMENTAIVFSNKYESYRNKIFGLYLICKTAIVLGFFFIVFFFPKFIVFLTNKPLENRYLIIVFLGVIAEGLLLVITTYLQSFERFLSRAIINIGIFFTRLLSVFILLKLARIEITLVSFLFAVSGIPFLVFFFKMFKSFYKSYIFEKLPKSIMYEIYSYEKWLFTGSISVNFMTRIDFFMVTYFLSFYQMGLYNSAFQLIAPFSMIPFSFGTVFLPKVSKYQNTSQVKSFLAKSTLFGILIMGIVAVIFPFSKQLISSLFGTKFEESYRIFQILLISSVVSLWAGNLSLVFYSLKHPRPIVIGTYIQLFVFILSAIFMIPHYGGKGAAWARVISNLAFLLVISLYLYSIIRKGKYLLESAKI